MLPNAGRNNEDIYSLFLHNQDSGFHNRMVVGSFYGARVLSDGIDNLGYVTTIGKIGKTGKAYGISHLHYELRYYPEWIQNGYNNMYSKGNREFQTRNNYHEDPQTFRLNAISFKGFSDEFRVNLGLNAYFERYGTGPKNESECITRFERATRDDNRPKNIWIDYSYSYNGSECTYINLIKNSGKSIIWSKTRSRLKVSVDDIKYNTKEQNDIDMLN